jgi:hypothetical protein
VSSTFPPGGPDGPEYLEQGGGSPVGSSTQPKSGGRRTAIVAGGAIGALVLVGGGVWAAMSFFGQGAQPAEALPDTTLGYASIDLDPSGGQKIEAIKMLRKFPAFKDEINLDTDDDIKKKLFDELNLDEACDGLDYADDLEPWLGDRAAVAAVDNGGDTPDAAFVVQVTDADAAEDGLAKLQKCGGGEDTGGWSISGEWVVVAETDKIAEQITDDAADSPLSEDDDFQKWTDEVGDPGVINMYAAPEAGKFLADAISSMAGGEDFSAGESCAVAPDDPAYDLMCGDDSFGGSLDESIPDGSTITPEIPEELTKAFEDFKGAALTIRFDDGAVEMEIAGDSAVTEDSLPASDAGDDVLATLPDDTAAAIGVGLPDGWFGKMLDQVSTYSGGEMTADDFIAEAEAETGLDLPDDVETLLGSSTAFAVGPDIDPEQLVNSDSPEGLPIGAKIKGDPDQIEAVLNKIRSQMGSQGDLLISKSDGDTIAIGPDEDYVNQLLEGGDLGDSDTFQNVVREAGDASTIVYVNFDAGDGWLVKLAGEDNKEAAENLEPLQGMGVSSWVEHDASHVVFRLTTN